MLQRRFASSIYAVRRSLERMRDKREKILADPEGYRQDQINKRLPDDFDDLPDEEQQEIIAELEDLVVSYDPAALRQEIVELGQLIDQARQLEKSRSRIQARQTPRTPHRPRHLQRPEDEAPHLHRAQGHARFPRRRRQGRPAPRQAASSGACPSPRSTAA